MPFCEVGKENAGADADAALNNAVKIFYRTYGHGPTKALLIIGLAGTHESWGPQIKGLTGTNKPNEDGAAAASQNSGDGESSAAGGIEVCAFDNRGMGRSSVPTERSEYTTKIMAKDAIALLDHLGWKKAHIIGHSMGAMIACKLAAMVPERVVSLALLNVTGGGFECFPKLDRKTLSIAMRFLKAKTPEQRAAVDLDTHYSEEYLDELVGTDTRRAILYQQYVKGISATGMQSKYGFDGQINACWMHKITTAEVERIRSAGFLVSVIHGRHDVIAQIYYARRLAQKLYPVAKMVDLHGGHLVSHERIEEVNRSLLEVMKASEMKTNPNDWANLPIESSGKYNQLAKVQCLQHGRALQDYPSSRGTSSSRYGFTTLTSSLYDFAALFPVSGYFRTRIAFIKPAADRESAISLAYTVVEKFHLCLLFLFSLLVLAFDYARRAFRMVKPVRVGPSLT